MDLSPLYYRSERDARTGYFIPGCYGNGEWLSRNSSAVAVVDAHPKSGCLVNYQILHFLTHIRDPDVLLVAIDS